MTKTKEKHDILCSFGKDTAVSGTKVGEIRKGIVSGSFVQQVKNEIQKPAKSK